MANYNSAMYTEHPFKVTDPEAFKKALDELGVNDAQREQFQSLCYVQETNGTFWLGGYDASLTVYKDPDYTEEVDISQIVQQHIAEDDYAILISSGYEKPRFVGGDVTVITRQKILYRSLDDVAKALIQEAQQP